MELNYTSTENKLRGTKLYLNIFENTSLVEKGFIPLDIIEQALKYRIPGTLQFFRWVEDDKGNITAEMASERFNIKTLVKECDEVREFANRYYQEYNI